MQTTVIFLTTRVKKPYEDDKMKLNRCLKYLKGKKHANLNIYVYSLSILKWWVYASYNMHDYYKVPTGDMMTI